MTGRGRQPRRRADHFSGELPTKDEWRREKKVRKVIDAFLRATAGLRPAEVEAVARDAACLLGSVDATTLAGLHGEAVR